MRACVFLAFGLCGIEACFLRGSARLGSPKWIPGRPMVSANDPWVSLKGYDEEIVDKCSRDYELYCRGPSLRDFTQNLVSWNTKFSQVTTHLGEDLTGKDKGGVNFLVGGGGPPLEDIEESEDAEPAREPEKPDTMSMVNCLENISAISPDCRRGIDLWLIKDTTSVSNEELQQPDQDLHASKKFMVVRHQWPRGEGGRHWEPAMAMGGPHTEDKARHHTHLRGHNVHHGPGAMEGHRRSWEDGPRGWKKSRGIKTMEGFRHEEGRNWRDEGRLGGDLHFKGPGVLGLNSVLDSSLVDSSDDVDSSSSSSSDDDHPASWDSWDSWGDFSEDEERIFFCKVVAAVCVLLTGAAIAFTSFMIFSRLLHACLHGNSTSRSRWGGGGRARRVVGGRLMSPPNPSSSSPTLGAYHAVVITGTPVNPPPSVTV